MIFNLEPVFQIQRLLDLPTTLETADQPPPPYAAAVTGHHSGAHFHGSQQKVRNFLFMEKFKDRHWKLEFYSSTFTRIFFIGLILILGV